MERKGTRSPLPLQFPYPRASACRFGASLPLGPAPRGAERNRLDARHWNAVVDGKEHPDVIWQYPEPLQDALRVRDAVGLYYERLDVLADGKWIESWPSFFTK